MRARPRPLAALTPLIVLAAMAGCGGQEEAPAGRTVTVPGEEPVEIVARDYSFDPSGIVASAGGPLELTLDNQGSVAHNLRVFDGATELGGTPTFQGGEAREATLELEPGSYRMVCTVANHEDLGMVGDIEVR
jgi:plastocyanin